ncbi:UNVERIFIED_CONTAM: hypothetical protein PYX00_004770 [Menopon gallinae]|uniref:Uncharacterized protein n=1 Tax=Menopon gallinae TaxID=328185 RepID=A0AAW2I5Q4_9NEOP
MVPIVLITLYFGGARASECDFRCRAVRGIDQFAADNVEVSDGVSLVRTAENGTGRTAGDSVLSALRDFVGRYDLRVKLHRFLPPREEVAAGLRKALTFVSEEARGNGGKKGGLLMAATMMGGTMAALGFGALGMLAMKALTVSAMALLLSVITAVRRMTAKNEHESGHIVSYVPVHHGARRRRDLPLLLTGSNS